MARVKEVVDYAYNQGLYVILNTMHEDFTENPSLNTDYVKVGEELSAIWKQIAEVFKDYDQHLIFESMNEPRQTNCGSEWSGSVDGFAAVNYLNQVFVNTIRINAKGYNDERCLMIPGYAASSGTGALNGISLPTYNGEVCNNLIVSVHSYTPYNFCLSDDSDTFDENGAAAIDKVYEDIQSCFLDYGIAVVMGETGATNTGNNTAERAEWAKYFTSTSAKYGVPVCLWDNGNNDSVGGECHSYIDRRTGEWRTEFASVIDGFINGYKDTEWNTVEDGVSEDSTAGREIKYMANGTVWATSASYPASPSFTNLIFEGWYTTPDYREGTELDISTVSGSIKAFAKYSLDLEAVGLSTGK